jgi:hypothetical protein
MVLLGDIHGYLDSIVQLVDKSKLKDTYIIQVGDFEIGFRKDNDQTIGRLNKWLSKFNVTLLVIRGNHDNPNWFNGDKVWSHVKFLEDYTVMRIEDKNILFVGGAISINRKQKAATGEWFPGEVFKLDIPKLESFRDIDMVVTHNAPTFVYPFGCDAPIIHKFAKNDPTLIADLIAERKELNIMHDILIKNNYIKSWHYGHFHQSHEMNYGSCYFQLLGVCEAAVYKNSIFD